jgi:putative cell wall-binding protein
VGAIQLTRLFGEAQVIPVTRLAAGAMLLAMLTVAPAGPAGGAERVEVERLGGTSRVETAVRISEETWPESRYDAFLARADLFPDALVASYPAGAFNGGGPLLLTPSHELHPAVRQELERLDVERVFIMGSFAAIAPEVEAQVRALGIETYRTFGRDRYGTARSAASLAPENFGVAFVATGTDFADALAAGPLAYALRQPIFLTPPDELHPEAAEGLRERGISEVVVVGGPGAVSERVARQIEQVCHAGGPRDCIRTRRIGGRDRTETAALLADELVEVGEVTLTHVNLARGDAFPDAAAGGPHGGQEMAPILLATSPDRLGPAAGELLRAHAEEIESIHAFGTQDALSDRVLEEARQAATSP